MKKALAILICIFFIASGLRISIDRHYCGGFLAGTKISLTGEKASCGMEPTDFSNSIQFVFNSKCCEDLMSFFTMNSNFSPEYYRLDIPFPVQHIMAYQKINPDENGLSNVASLNRIFPPGEHLTNCLTRSYLCIYRI
jgi:hypothetical protein